MPTSQPSGAARRIRMKCVTSVVHDPRASARGKSGRAVKDRWTTDTRACSTVRTPSRARPSGHVRTGRAPVVHVDDWVRVRVDETSRLELESRHFGGGVEREASLGSTLHASAGEVVRGRGGTCRLRPRTVVRPAWSMAARCGLRLNSAVDRLEHVSHDRLSGDGQRVGRPARAAHDTCVVSGPGWPARVAWAGAALRVSWTDGCGDTLEWRSRTGKADVRRLRRPSNWQTEDPKADFDSTEETAKGMGSTNTALRMSGVFEVPGEPQERSLSTQ